MGRNFVANQRDAELVGYAYLADQVGLYRIHPHPRIVLRCEKSCRTLAFAEGISFFGRESATICTTDKNGNSFWGGFEHTNASESCIHADLTPIPSCAARINLLLWCFIRHHLFKPMEATFSRSRKRLIKRDSTCCWEGGGHPADSSRLALPPAIKRNVSINPEKRPRTRATKFIVRVEKTTLVVLVFVCQMDPATFQGPGIKQK